MQVPKNLKKIFHKLGTSNESDFTTATLAGFKLLFVPLATMNDKKATKEQKEYAITRDVLTEIIALTGYLGITKAVKTLAPAPLCKQYYKNKLKFIEKNLNESIFRPEDLKMLRDIGKEDIEALNRRKN